jgi:hypothetical protein
MAKMGFGPLTAALAKEPGIRDPKALAATIGRKKLGKKAFQARAAKGRADSEKAGG